MSRPIHCATTRRVEKLGGTIVVLKSAIATVGWLAYGRDTEGNGFGMTQMDAAAK